MNTVSDVNDDLLQKFLMGKEAGIIHRIVEDNTGNGRTITLNEKRYLFFGNCSYLGMDQNELVKYQSIEATLKYGTSFSSSRTYVSLKFLNEAEERLAEVFGHPALISQTTWLGHIALIPMLATRGDAIVLDHQVHTSVQSAVQIARANGVHVEMVRHNRMDLLEEKIITLSRQYKKVWYMADGIYSMFGDSSPLKELTALLNKYEQFYLYLDDAHGMSWVGKNGRGFVLNEMKYHSKMCLATSLSKGFGSTAAALVFHDEKMKDLVKLTGAPYIFSNPPSPGVIGAIVGSASVHLSDEIYTRQQYLEQLMRHFVTTCRELELPLINEELTPVFYIATGLVNKNSIIVDVIRKIMEQGYFVNTCSYPSVSLKNEGIRITLTTHLTKQDITGLLTTIAGILKGYDLKKEAIISAFLPKAASIAELVYE